MCGVPCLTSESARLANSASGAGAEQLDGVINVGKSVLGGHLGSPGLDFVAADLHRRPT